MNIKKHFSKLLIPKKKYQLDGFTLVELLVVVIILGVLSSIAIPNFVRQIGKARETEGKSILGSLARAQQAYHIEKQTFATTIVTLTLPSPGVTSSYYTFPNPTADDSKAKHQAIGINPITDQVRNYAVGMYFTAGLFEMSLCEGTDFGVAVNVGDLASDVCTNNGIKIK